MGQTRTSFCRFCHALCGIQVTVDNGKVVKVTGDVENPIFRGFTCAKGRELPADHNHPDRLLRSIRREADGSFTQLSSANALDEVAERLRRIVDEDGPRAVAAYMGTAVVAYPAAGPLAKSFLDALGSPMYFTPGTIDQPGKFIAAALHGKWGGGVASFNESDVWMFVGTNPIVSMHGGTGVFSPSKQLRDAKARGMKLIAVDPRRTELAAMADAHLRPKPGEDPALLAGLVRIILEEGRHDASFCAEHVKGLEELRRAVVPFTPSEVERRTGVKPHELIRVAHMLSAARRGAVTVGTGPNMARYGALTEYLCVVLTTICNLWRKTGDEVANPGVLMPARAWKAQAVPMPPAYGFGERMRVKGLADTVTGMCTAACADEILLDGPGRIRALIVMGGNPVAAWPDQLKVIAAMKKLDLLVCIDPKLNATSRLGHYVFAPKLSLEVPGMTQPREQVPLLGATFHSFPKPYAMHSPAIVDPPEHSDLLEEWEVFYGLAQRMGLGLELSGTHLDMSSPPTTDRIYDLLTQGSRIPLDRIRQFEHGHVFDDERVVVEAADPDRADSLRLEVGHPVMLDQLAEVAAEPVLGHAGFRAEEPYAFRLISRRMRDVYNSKGFDLPRLMRKHSYNPAFMNPRDLTALGIVTGGIVEITSSRASITGIVEAAEDVPPGVISMAHCWGDVPERDDEFRSIGSCTGRLVDSDRDYDPFCGIPVMSAIPVNVRAAAMQSAITEASR